MKIIAISGKKRHGKDTLANFMWDLCPLPYKVAQENFADPLKREASEAFGIPIEQFYDDTLERWWLKWLLIGLLWPKLCGPARKERWRKLLQFYGTEYRRNNFGQNYWVDKYKERVAELKAEGVDILFTADMRFPNELAAIKELGGKTVRVWRSAAAFHTGDPHPSETALDEVPVGDWDFWVFNDSSKADLYDEAFGVLDAVMNAIP